jgi:hypothetical protein
LELYLVFGEKYHKDIILLAISVDPVIKYTFLLENLVHIVEEKVWEK